MAQTEMERLRALTDQLNRYRYEYYTLNAPTVDDAVYDRLFDELGQLEKALDVRMGNSPTITVGWFTADELKKTTHPIPLLSLDKTKQVDELCSFMGDQPVMLMLKLDGLTIKVTYESGMILEAAMAEETLLRSIIPAVATTGHRLAKFSVFHDLNETVAGIVTALVAMNQSFRTQGSTMALYQLLHRFQNKVQLQRFAENIRENLFGKCVQDGREVAKPAVIGDISDVRQQHLPGAMILKFAVYQVIRNMVGPQGLRHPSVRIGLPNRAKQPILVHESAYLFDVHDHRRRQVKQTHLYPSGPLVVATKPVCIKDQLKVL